MEGEILSENENDSSTNLNYYEKNISKIIKLFNSAKINELIEIFDNCPEDNEEEQINKFQKSILKKNVSQAVQFIMALFQASNSTINNLRHLKRKKNSLFCFIKWLERSNSSIKSSTEKIITEAINFLITELDSFTDIILIKLCNHIIEAIKKKKDICPQLFDIIPPILQIISADKVIKNDTDNSSYKNEFISSLLELEWDKNISIHIISMFKDISLNKNQIELVSENIINRFDILDISELPSAIYQLLLITKKGNKNSIIIGIINYFCKLEEANADNSEKYKNIKQIEGTVILQICLGMNLDHSLGLQFIKYMKETKTSKLTKFNISLLLSMAKIHRYEDMIFDYLKSTIFKCFKDNLKIEKSVWLNEYYPFKILDISELMLSIVKDSTIGNEQIIQSMVKLGFILVDTMTLMNAPFSKQVDKIPSKNEEKNPYNCTCDLGIHILYKLFKLHDIVRMSILDEIMSRILSKSSSIFKILELFEKIIKKCSNATIPYHNKILECIDYISPLSSSMAEMLFNAIIPIVNNNMNFKNTVLLNLRKRLYNKENNSRQNALIGFIVLLKSQCDMIKNLESEDIQSAKNSKMLIYEILGNIRRCFKQQPEIRLKLYEYLLTMIDEYENIVPSIFEIVYNQFKNYLGESDGNLVLKLSSCTEGSDEPYIIEPLSYLLSVLTKSMSVMVRTENLNVYSKLFEKSRELISHLITSITELEVDAFGINTTSDSSDTGLVNLNDLYIFLLLGCQEALMEYVYRVGGYSVESAQSIMSINKRHNDLLKMIKDKRKKSGNNLDSSIFSLMFLSDIVDFIFSNDESNFQRAMDIYKSNPDFIQYLINVINSRLNNQFNEVMPHYVEDVRQYAIIGRSLLYTFFENQDFSKPIIDLTNKITRSQFSYILDCLIIMVKIIVKNYPEKLNEFMILITGNQNDSNLIYDITLQFKGMVDLLISNEISMNSQAISILDCIGKFFDLSLYDSNQKNVIKDWLLEVCINSNVEDSSLAKSLITQLFKFSDNDYENELFFKVAKISLFIIEPILDGDDDESFSFDMKIINKKTYTSIVMTLFGNLNEILDEVDWCIEQIKIWISRKKAEEKESLKEQMKTFEKQLYKKMKYVILTLNVIEQAKLKGSLVENCLKLLSKTYKVLSSFLKLKLRDYKLIDPEYVEMMNSVSSSLTQDLYEFIFYRQKEDVNEANESSKKNKKGGNYKQKTRIVRESKLVPNLIYLVEIYERYLIQVTKKTGVNFLSVVKRSISRDFRIQIDQINNQGNEGDMEEGMEEEEEEDEDMIKKKIKVENYDQEEE
jgi:hypothetical protein